MKVYFLAPEEGWIVDTFKRQWDGDNADIATQDPNEADVLWACADWCWTRLNPWLGKKKLLVTCHHYVPEKFSEQEFRQRDQFVTAYHVPNEHTEAFIKPFTSKPIRVIPYWADQRMWRPTGTKRDLRMKHGLPLDGFLIGSFQRDTEGKGLPTSALTPPIAQVTPKSEKNPVGLVEYYKHVAMHRPGVGIVVSSWRRHSLILELMEAQKNGLDIRVFSNTPEFDAWSGTQAYGAVQELRWTDQPNWRVIAATGPKVSQEIINELYQCVDLYAITAQYEGGPQSLIECGLLNVPVVSTPVGMANHVFRGESSTAIAKNIADAKPAVPHVEDLKLPQGYEPYLKVLASL